MEYLIVYECKELHNPTGLPICYIKDTPMNVSAFIVQAEYNKKYAFIKPNKEIKLFSAEQMIDIATIFQDYHVYNALMSKIQKGKIVVPCVEYVQPPLSEIDKIKQWDIDKIKSYLNVYEVKSLEKPLENLICCIEDTPMNLLSYFMHDVNDDKLRFFVSPGKAVRLITRGDEIVDIFNDFDSLENAVAEFRKLGKLEPVKYVNPKSDRVKSKEERTI